MTFVVDTKFEVDDAVVDRTGKSATVIDAKMNYSTTMFSYKIAYLLEYENLERRWNDENTIQLASAVTPTSSTVTTTTTTTTTTGGTATTVPGGSSSVSGGSSTGI